MAAFDVVMATKLTSMAATVAVATRMAVVMSAVFFCKNSLSYKKNKKWRLSVHIQFNSTCTDNYQ
jgi:hypothetical protein